MVVLREFTVGVQTNLGAHAGEVEQATRLLITTFDSPDLHWSCVLRRKRVTPPNENKISHSSRKGEVKNLVAQSLPIRYQRPHGHISQITGRSRQHPAPNCNA